MTKKLIIITSILVALVLLTVAGARLRAGEVEVTVQSASERAEEFHDLYQAVEHGDLDKNQFASMSADDPGGYSFVTYTVKLSSTCLMSAEWALLGVAPAEGDVALLQGDPVDVSPFGSATVTATILTRAQNPQTARTVWVDYYVCGSALSTPVVN